jgi:hypothetical protein
MIQIDLFPNIIRGIFISFITIYFFDKIIKRTLSRAHWFTLHSIINFIIVFFSLNDLKLCLQDINNSSLISHNNTILSCSLILTLHVYHTIMYKMTKMDAFHHYLFVFCVSPLTILYSGKGLSMLCFFSCGLPGGIDYFLLSLVKYEKIHYLTEKNLNSYLNAYIRMPGGFISSFIILKDGMKSADVSFYSNIILSFLIFYNSAYFGKLAIENYVERKMSIELKLLE